MLAELEARLDGMTSAVCSPGFAQRSFAAYYDTEAPPREHDGRVHSTTVEARSDERKKRCVQMPLEAAEKIKRAVWPSKTRVGLGRS
jgi:hypothetical protein